MNKLTLTRIAKTDNFTAGVLEVCGEKFYTLENPWLDNQQNVSCIPEGFYKFSPFSGNKYKNVWEIEDVNGRTYILLHAGNYTRDTHGCVLVGNGLSVSPEEAVVTDSKSAINRMRELMLKDNGVIEIRSL